ncbi:MAG: gamma-glutamyltransferase, partial [Acidobacteriota bacterium]
MKNVVAAGHEVTARAVQETIQKGGNAFDGAVAGVFTSMIAESTLTSAGGGGCLLAKPAGSDPILFDFFVDMPSGRPGETMEFFPIEVDFGPTTQEFHVGRGATAVPGSVAGLVTVNERLGRLPLSEVLKPAIQAAEQGVVLGPGQAYLIKILAPILTREPLGREVYTPQGRLPRASDRLAMPEFARFLERLGEEGSDYLYRNDGARRILEWSKVAGGLITLEDLAGYKVIERRPLHCRFAGCDVFLNPPPAQSGWLIEIVLSLLEETAGKKRRPGLGELISAMALANEIRFTHSSDGLSVDGPLPFSRRPEFRSYVHRYLERLPAAPPAACEGRGSTTQLSVIDREGNAASVTTTNGEGCGAFVPGLGFMPNNMLGEQDLNPAGVHRYAPGSRLSTMLAPTIVTREGEPVLVTGSAGSNRIRSVVVQLLVNVLDRGMSLAEATAAPRIHLEGDLL